MVETIRESGSNIKPTVKTMGYLYFYKP